MCYIYMIIFCAYQLPQTSKIDHFLFNHKFKFVMARHVVLLISDGIKDVRVFMLSYDGCDTSGHEAIAVLPETEH